MKQLVNGIQARLHGAMIIPAIREVRIMAIIMEVVGIEYRLHTSYKVGKADREQIMEWSLEIQTSQAQAYGRHSVLLIIGIQQGDQG